MNLCTSKDLTVLRRAYTDSETHTLYLIRSGAKGPGREAALSTPSSVEAVRLCLCSFIDLPTVVHR